MIYYFLLKSAVYDEIDETQLSVGQHNAPINPVAVAARGRIGTNIHEQIHAGAIPEPHYEPMQNPSYQAIVPKGGSLLPDIRVSDLKKYITSLKDKAGVLEEEFKVRNSNLSCFG